MTLINTSAWARGLVSLSHRGHTPAAARGHTPALPAATPHTTAPEGGGGGGGGEGDSAEADEFALGESASSWLGTPQFLLALLVRKYNTMNIN
jgi:hypothetical protein